MLYAVCAVCAVCAICLLIMLYAVCRYISTYTGTVTDDDQEAWNITKLNTILDYVSEDYGIKIEGEI